MALVRIQESCVAPITHGTLEVDTSQHSITIFLNAVPAHAEHECLTIRKITDDKNTVTVAGNDVMIDDAEFLIFGLHKQAKVSHGKNTTIVLRSVDVYWKIIAEY